MRCALCHSSSPPTRTLSFAISCNVHLGIYIYTRKNSRLIRVSTYNRAVARKRRSCGIYMYTRIYLYMYLYQAPASLPGLLPDDGDRLVGGGSCLQLALLRLGTILRTRNSARFLIYRYIQYILLLCHRTFLSFILRSPPPPPSFMYVYVYSYVYTTCAHRDARVVDADDGGRTGRAHHARTITRRSLRTHSSSSSSSRKRGEGDAAHVYI